MAHGVRRRQIHFWREPLLEPPCGTPEESFERSGAIEDVTCEGCLEALAGDSGDLASRDAWEPPGPPGP